ncbi:oxidoreductase domain protein [Fibrisoma limi BUZ 3]|uniref:Oxidoreductase domain protein n=1 Tax=Fibrisoma limi BUZ 3 TaxID=1185876 RepID=I2GG79_9BACT|nr:Gfo/Idh/MocA family oxidoreductase [Fibrisoma limi]CCH52904.1 oxidoreductase domain protein [Fibrisoma limi BUZ 3]
MNRPSLWIPNNHLIRRDFIRHLGAAAFAVPGLASLMSLQACGSKNESPGETAGTDAAGSGRTESGRKLGVALVGLGNYSEGQLGPALKETKNCRLAGIVTGTPDKIDKWKREYDIPDKNVYNYDTFDQIADNPDIDIVYVVLPDAMHADYTVRAAQAGKHVICEKPMALNSTDCQRMIDACNKAGKKLSIGYRLHFEPHNQEMMRLGQKEVFGNVNQIIAENGQDQSEKDSPWRLGKGTLNGKPMPGGGPLHDVGVYCIQGVVYTKGEIPVSVTAKYHPITDKDKFSEVEQGVDFQMQFADGSVANCRTSFNEKYNKLRAEAANGWFELQPAYAYDGLKGQTSNGSMDIENVNQQARQMDAFADCILNDKPSSVPGEMGMRDVQLIEAIERAAKTGNKVSTQEVRKVLDSTAVARA